MSLPVNFQNLDVANVGPAVAYAKEVIASQLRLLKRADLEPEGLNFLEIGPGSDFGPALILASAGARVTVADRFLTGWHADFHRELYRRLAEEWDGPVDQLRAAVEGGYEATTLVRAQEPAEALVSIPDASIDFVYSGAVLEHIVDLGQVAEELSRITKVGGRAAHQIDLRYHGNFARPLDHLAFPERDFVLAAEDSHNELGNRFRASEFVAHFGMSGFEVIAQMPNEDAPDAYLREFVPILRQARSAYRHWPEFDLRHVSVLFMLQKLAPEAATTLKYRSQAAVETIAALKAQTLQSVEREVWQPSIAYDDYLLNTAEAMGPHGLMWIANDEALPQGDHGGDNHGSSAVLLEDGKPLGPAHTLHDVIRARGGGRFAHWNQQVYFSTPDGSSPRTNGRQYALRVPRSGRFY